MRTVRRHRLRIIPLILAPIALVAGLLTAGPLTASAGVVDLPPDAVSGLDQYDPSLAQFIAPGGTTESQDIQFQGLVSDPDSSSVSMEVEVKAVGAAFDGTGTYSSSSSCFSSFAPAVASVSNSPQTSCANLGLGSYHWRARGVDDVNAPGPWTSFGDNGEGEADFTIVASCPSESSTPDAPTNVTAFPGNTTAAVSWDPPGNDGGATVDSYFVNVYESGGEGSYQVGPFTDTQAQINNLTNGTAYSFTVQAHNCNGNSLESEFSNEVTPQVGSSAEVIGPGNLSQTTGAGQPTAGDPEIGAQQFPKGTTGLGTLQELPNSSTAARVATLNFCNGTACLGSVLENKLLNGTVGDRPSGKKFYSARLLFDRTLATGTGTTFKVWYDGNLSDDTDSGGDPTPPRLLPRCVSTFTPIACVAKIVRLASRDLKVVVRTNEIDPRIGVR